MATILQFQTDPLLIEMMERHHAWHTPGGAHGFPSRQFSAGTANSGREFFQFHHDMITQFHVWNNMNNAVPPAQVAAWNAIPVALKVPSAGWTTNLANAETRITTNTPPFANDDALGIFVESTIHNWIHGAVAIVYSEPFIAQLHSPQSTYFYQIHGLVDFWWNQFLHPKTRIKDIIDTIGKVHIKEVIKDIKEIKELEKFKEVIKEHKEVIKEHKEVKEFKEKDKDLVEHSKLAIENIDIVRKLDPEILKLQARIQSLEALTKKGAPFIKPGERPEVGKKLAKRPARRKR